MKIFHKESNIEKKIIILYFASAFFEITAEFLYKPILFFLKPLTLILLLILYWKSSSRKNSFFFIAFLFLIFTRLFAILKSEEMLFFGLIFYFFHRIVMIVYVKKIIKLKDCIPLLIAMVPFLFIFFYLLSLTNNLSSRIYYGLIIQNVLLAILAGMTLSQYVMINDKKDFWLLIFGLLSAAQYFIVFIEKFYLVDLSPISFRPIAVILTTMVNYTFYKFVIATERSSND
jgi:hypothetical protein